MKNAAFKTFLMISVACSAGSASMAQHSPLDDKESSYNEQKSGKEINGLIKKMMLVASDVIKIKNEDYDNDDFSRVYELAQYQEDKSLIERYVEKRMENSPLDHSVDPDHWKKLKENYKNKVEDQKAKEEAKKEEPEEDKTAKSVISDDGVEIMIKRRPEENYRNIVLPNLVNKKSYSRENMHLPVAVYEEEYHEMLVRSIISQDIDVMRAIIERMETTEFRDKDGNTPLLYAVISGNIVPIKVLIGMGASVNVQNNHGVTPLYVATKDIPFS